MTGNKNQITTKHLEIRLKGERQQRAQREWEREKGLQKIANAAGTAIINMRRNSCRKVWWIQGTTSKVEYGKTSLSSRTVLQMTVTTTRGRFRTGKGEMMWDYCIGRFGIVILHGLIHNLVGRWSMSQHPKEPPILIWTDSQRSTRRSYLPRTWLER